MPPSLRMRTLGIRDLVTRRVRVLVVEVELEADPAPLIAGTGEGGSRSEGKVSGESEGESGRDDNEDAGEGHEDTPFDDVGKRVDPKGDEGREYSASSTLTT